MFRDLNEKQKEAVFWEGGALLIVAGAGSGKTKTLTARLAFLITQKGVDPQKILAITFTNKAAEEMKSRVKNFISKEKLKINHFPFVGTFHSLGAKILREEAKLLKRTPNFSIFDDDDSLRLIKKIVKEKGLSSFYPATLMKKFSWIKNELVEEKRFFEESEEEKKDLIWEIFQDYELALERNNAFDFDDLIQKVVWLFKNSEEIRKKHQKRYHYILVDEYQDINSAQYWLLRLLVGEKGNLNVVGDDAQSIYSFRFSDFRNFLNFEHDWPQAKVVFLEQNYRSTKNIIESSSVLISKNTLGKKKNLWTENEEGSLIKVVEHQDEFEEANFIVEQASYFANQGKSVGILFRTNAQSRPLEQLFLEMGKDYNLFGAFSFYERKEIKDVVAGLRLAFNPNDEISKERLKTNFSQKITLLWEEALSSFKKEAPPLQLIEAFLKITNYLERLKKDYSNYQERWENIQELIYFASQFESLADFLEKVSLVSPLDLTWQRRKRKTKNPLVPSLMTIHLAKGLEFDVVLVAGVNEGILPHQRSLFSLPDLEEERRLMYVAMTRARKELFLNFYGTPSRFLYEIPPEKVEFWGRNLEDEEGWIDYN
ncbi:MAG: UvrD-helicase domain-containing protein [Patescibacteria group bacterium]|nr:UvrD-helicase domain-containing protein [Patescibacteria group bacterium]